jgi:hypothetical protein
LAALAKTPMKNILMLVLAFGLLIGAIVGFVALERTGQRKAALGFAAMIWAVGLLIELGDSHGLTELVMGLLSLTGFIEIGIALVWLRLGLWTRIAVCAAILVALFLLLFADRIPPDSMPDSSTPLLTTPEDITAYRGHRLLVWFFDSKTHQVRGFADATVRPEESARLGPAGGARYDLDAGCITRQKICGPDGLLVSEYDGVRYVLRYEKGGVEGIASLIWPQCEPHHIARGLDAVDFMIPVGPAAIKPLAERLPAKFRGAAGELEDLILACLPRWKAHFPVSSVISIYQLVGPTQRAEQWLELLHGADPDLRFMAAAVLTLAGNAEGVEVLCQTAGPLTLVEMPPSTPVLKRLVSSLLEEGPIMVYDICGDCPPTEMRPYLIEKITKKYTREDLRPYAPQLLRRTKDCSERWADDLREFLKEEADRS